MTLTPLSGYTAAADAVSMYAACATACGRIFLGGADGHVYEVAYGRGGRCRKAAVTQTVLGMLSAVVPRLLTGHEAAAVAGLVMDRERGHLYALLQNSAIQARSPWSLPRCVCTHRVELSGLSLAAWHRADVQAA